MAKSIIWIKAVCKCVMVRVMVMIMLRTGRRGTTKFGIFGGRACTSCVCWGGCVSLSGVTEKKNVMGISDLTALIFQLIFFFVSSFYPV